MSCGRGEEFIVNWRIENYSFCNHRTGEVIESPFIRVECLGGSEWKLHLVPRELNDEQTEVTQCYLKRYDSNGVIWIDYRIEMLDPNGAILETAQGLNEKFETNFDSNSILEIKTTELDVQQWKKNTLTVRCRMKHGGPHFLPAIGCEVRTKIGVESHISSWEIDLPLINSVFKEFSILEKTKLKTEISKSGMNCTDPIVIRMNKIESGAPLSRFVSCKVTLLDVSGKEVKSGCDGHFFEPDNQKEDWEFPSFLTYLDLQKYSYEGKKVILQFDVTVTNGINSETPSNFQYSTNALLILQENMRALFRDPKYADCELKIIPEGSKLCAHKSILTARSPVLSRLFGQDMLESKTNIIEVNTDEQTMRAFLEFLYTGTVEKFNCDCAMKLLEVADYYQVPSLEDKCASYLINALTITNVCKVLSFAFLIDHEQLKNTALDYIALHLKEVMLLDEWAMVTDREGLVEEILSTMANKFKMVPNTETEK